MATGASSAKLYRLYVGNIPWTISHSELRQYFSKFGPVNLATVVFDKNTGFSKNFGFVHFGNRESFEKAHTFHLHKLEGNTLRVQTPNLDSGEDQN